MKKLLQILFVFTLVFVHICSAQDNTTWDLAWMLRSNELPIFVRGWELKCGSDIDQDGYGEILTQSSETATFQLYEAMGDNLFDPVWYYNMPESRSNMRTTSVTDWDMDGIKEITIFGDVAASVDAMHVFEWDGTDNGFPLEPIATWDPQRNDNNSPIFEADGIYINLDADPGYEMVLPHADGANAVLQIMELSNSSFENPQWKTEYFEGGSGSTWALAVGDLDMDGNMEIIHANNLTQSLTVIQNVAEDQYEVEVTWEASDIDPDFSVAHSSLAVANFAEGYPELFIITRSGRIFVLEHEGDLTAVNQNNFHMLYKFGVWGADDLRGISIGDQDKDGKPDIYFGNITDGSLYDFEFEGGSPYDPDNYTMYKISDDIGHVGNVKIGNELGDVMDLDGDMLKEVVVVTGYPENMAPALQVFENLSIGTKVENRAIISKPKKYILDQNFPNPFNPQTIIEYSLPESGDIRLVIRNILGEEVKSINRFHDSGGSYSFVWNGRDYHGELVASGLYFYSIETQNIKLTRKMLLAR